MAEYLTEMYGKLVAAKLSGDLAGKVPAAVADEEAFCKMATDNMLQRVRQLLRTEVTTSYQKGHAAGSVPVGYGILATHACTAAACLGRAFHRL